MCVCVCVGGARGVPQQRNRWALQAQNQFDLWQSEPILVRTWKKRELLKIWSLGLTPVLPTAEATQCFVVVASASLKECQFLIFPNPSFLNRSCQQGCKDSLGERWVDTRDNIRWWTIPGSILGILAHLKTQQQSKRKDSLGVWRGRGWDPKSHSQSHAAWSEQKSLEGSTLVFNTIWPCCLVNFFYWHIFLTDMSFWLAYLWNIWYICGILWNMLLSW